MRKLFLLCMLLMASATLLAQKSADARKVLDQTTSKFEKAGAIKTDFSLTQYDAKNQLIGDMNGHILLKGKQFNTTTPEMITWFDGKTQWSYLVVNDEVNIIYPTQEELQAMNPYAFLALYKKGFNYTLSEAKLNGKPVYEVRLTPEKSQQEIQEIRLSIEKNSYIPLLIRLQKAGESIHIQLTNYQTGATATPDSFRFDAKAYPRAEIIDLR